MGCDFVIQGHLFSHKAQEKVIAFLADYFGGAGRVITPRQEEAHATLRLRISGRVEERLLSVEEGLSYHRTVYETNDLGLVEVAYPFDFYGLIVNDQRRLTPDCQFIFDRGRGGQMVKFHCLPPEHGLEPYEYYHPRPGVEVAIEPDAYARMEQDELSFAMALYVIQQRWWPSLRVRDDWRHFQDVAQLVEEANLQRRLRDESLDVDACDWLFQHELDKRRHPPLVLVPDGIRQRPIQELNLCARALTCLPKAGINTVGELMEHSAGDLLAIKNLTRKVLGNIREALAEVGVYIKD